MTRMTPPILQIRMTSFRFLKKFTTNLPTRNLFANSYLDSNVFRVQMKNVRGDSENTTKQLQYVKNLYLQTGLHDFQKEDFQILIHCSDNEKDMQFCARVFEEYAVEEPTNLNSYRMLMNLYFWKCYIKKDSVKAKQIFDISCHNIDSYHTKNRYFSTLLRDRR